MSPSELTIEVFDSTLTRRGQILPQYWTDVKAALNLRAVGAWSMTLPTDLPEAQLLAQPGSGILITGPGGELFSGITTQPDEKADQSDPAGSTTFTGVDFNVLLDDALAYPVPASVDVTAQTSAYDVRTGPAETVARSLVDANIGPSAPAARRAGWAAQLTLEPDRGRGATVTALSRFDPLLAQAAALTKLGGIGFRVTTIGGDLRLQFFEPRDLSRIVRLDIANGLLTSYEHTVSAPSITRAIVAGQGEAELRTFLERSTPDSIAAEASWGRRIERFVDQRNTDDPVELAQGGDDALADGGQTVETLKLTPTDDVTMRYGRDWFLGDYITAVIKDREIPQVVTQTVIAINTDGIQLGATVGDLDADDLRALSLARRVQRLETRI